MMRPALLAAVLALALPASSLAQDGTPVDLEVGKKVRLCEEGLATCPASVVRCDDPGVAFIEIGAEGPELEGVSPGTTLCSAAGPGGANPRLLRVTVLAPQSGEGGGKE